MDLLLAFVITLALITLVSVRYRISPFFTLVGGSVLFGLLGGLTLDATLLGIIAGIGKVFSAFGIIILCGAVIAKLLQEQHQIEEIVADIRQRVKNPPVIAGLSGYILAVPITCCITAYIMLNPILDSLEKDPRKRAVLFYLVAVGSIISYALVYPTPVVIPLFDAFSDGMSPLIYDALSIPLSLAALAGILLFFRWWCGAGITSGSIKVSGPDKRQAASFVAGPGSPVDWRAWIPFIAILVSIPVALFILRLSQGSVINFIMLVGAVTSLALAPHPARSQGCHRMLNMPGSSSLTSGVPEHSAMSSLKAVLHRRHLDSSPSSFPSSSSRLSLQH